LMNVNGRVRLGHCFVRHCFVRHWACGEPADCSSAALAVRNPRRRLRNQGIR
jgi:hypothetical protein